MIGDGVVTVCIPTFQAEAFIDRTLRCARAQTYEALRVVVSIDRSDDGTEEICRSHADADDRVQVHAHAERLGWVDNVNFLLDAVRSEYEFVYFHDDVIEPTYCAVLVAAVRHRPDAASAHCDVLLYGAGNDRLKPGCTYDGSAAIRLLTYLVSPNRGALLRSMVRRSSQAGRLRMTVAGALYEMALVAAGPAVHVAEPLYQRWEQRTGGLTHGLAREPFEDVFYGWAINAALARELVGDLALTAEERALLDFALAVHMTNRLLLLETIHGDSGPDDLGDVLGPAADLEPPDALEGLPEHLRSLCTASLARARARTAARTR